MARALAPIVRRPAVDLGRAGKATQAVMVCRPRLTEPYRPQAAGVEQARPGHQRRRIIPVQVVPGRPRQYQARQSLTPVEVAVASVNQTGPPGLVVQAAVVLVLRQALEVPLARLTPAAVAVVAVRQRDSLAVKAS